MKIKNLIPLYNFIEKYCSYYNLDIKEVIIELISILEKNNKK